MVDRRALLGLVTVPVLLAVAELAAPAAALAAHEPSGAASCMGIEQASISPPGSSDEVPGGAPQFIRDVKQLAAGVGAPAGALISFVASLHAGSHDDCDAVLYG